MGSPAEVIAAAQQLTPEQLARLDDQELRVAVLEHTDKVVMECILETKAATILEFFAGLRGTLSVTFEEGTSAAWLYDLLRSHVARVLVCHPRKNASSSTSTRGTASMRASWRSCYVAPISIRFTTAKLACVHCANWSVVI